MHLALDDDSEMLRSAVHDFAKGRVRPKARDWDEAGAIPPAALDEGHGLGLLAAGIPSRYGGAGEEGAKPSAVTGVVALEELAFADLAYAAALLAPNHLAVPVGLFGSEEEKAKRLPALSGDKRPSVGAAWIEPSRTFDLAAVAAAAKDGAVSGSKAFAHPVQTRVVYARSAATQGFEGIGAFLVEGKPTAAREDAIGLRGAALERVTFEAAPAVALPGIDYRRLATRALTASAAAAVGVAKAACEYAAAYAKERVAFGRPIAQYQSIAFMIAEAATDAEAAHWMTLKAAWRIHKGDDALPAASLAFRFATDAAWRIADHGVQILGGHGVIRDHLAELFFRNARTLASTPGLFIV